ncbi:MAG: VIT family protein [Sporolactobacillus sp.]|jgi:VIT1/CCC1 family predicted Fe2+/Mn2+ transporter|nr:VIT family protein [Sporolactobacillus sp.]
MIGLSSIGTNGHKYIRQKSKKTLAQKINMLRAAVMGANDGIISVAGIVLGVAGATTNQFAILISGFGGMLAGTISMAMGEYVSVNSQKDAQEKAIVKEKRLLQAGRDGQCRFVADKLRSSGISPKLSQKAAEEMMARNALHTVVREKYGFDAQEVTSPYAAALASMLSFPTGSLLPMAAIAFLPMSVKIIGTFAAVLVALVLTGYMAALLGRSNKMRSVVRNTMSGMLTMLVTYFIGALFA